MFIDEVYSNSKTCRYKSYFRYGNVSLQRLSPGTDLCHRFLLLRASPSLELSRDSTVTTLDMCFPTGGLKSIPRILNSVRTVRKSTTRVRILAPCVLKNVSISATIVYITVENYMGMVRYPSVVLVRRCCSPFSCMVVWHFWQMCRRLAGWFLWNEPIYWLSSRAPDWWARWCISEAVAVLQSSQIPCFSFLALYLEGDVDSVAFVSGLYLVRISCARLRKSRI